MSRLLPHERLRIAEAKLTGYLLDTNHPEGGSKAKFLMFFGFRSEKPEAVREALVAHATTANVLSIRNSNFGTLYEIAGPLPSPDERNPVVNVIWMIDTGSTAPRLITLARGKDKP